ncbi:hypothetical protein Tco_0955883 [Tanacetum coccineum]|uniref:Uncharacterized protein n=1 Tax=Tanacetum coccineum TaxID=301880 RepID=A0ABQ5E8K5_9ASTR
MKFQCRRRNVSDLRGTDNTHIPRCQPYVCWPMASLTGAFRRKRILHQQKTQWKPSDREASDPRCDSSVLCDQCQEDDKRRRKAFITAIENKTKDLEDHFKVWKALWRKNSDIDYRSILRVLRIILVILPEHPSETKVLHNEDGNPARANIKQALGRDKNCTMDMAMGISSSDGYQVVTECSDTTYLVYEVMERPHKGYVKASQTLIRKKPSPTSVIFKHQISNSFDSPLLHLVAAVNEAPWEDSNFLSSYRGYAAGRMSHSPVFLEQEITSTLMEVSTAKVSVDLPRACPHHGFLELHQLDTFYNALNSNDQDSLNSAAGGNFLDKMPRECLKLNESKSKVRQSRNKAIVSKVSTSSSTPGISPDVAELKDMVKALLLDKKNQSQAPATVKAVEKSCVTCGGAHSHRNCPATDGNIYFDNI